MPMDLLDGTPTLLVPARSPTARTWPNFKRAVQTKSQRRCTHHGLATVWRADEENGVLTSSGHNQSPLGNFIAVDDRSRILVVRCGFGSPCDFLLDLILESGKAVVGHSEEIHRGFPG